MSVSSNFVCGIHSAKSLLNAEPNRVRRVLIADNYHGAKLHEVMVLARALGIQTKHVPRAVLDRIATDIAHQGVVLETRAFQTHSEAELIDALRGWELPLILALDSIQDPRNLGACIRTAEGAGVDAVVVGKNRTAPLSGVVHKTSAGALDSTFFVEVSNLARTLTRLSEEGCWILGASDNADHQYSTVDFREPTVLVVGGEAKGIRRLTAERCDRIVSIPMGGTVPSLNVAVATGILLFEAIRQRQLPDSR